MGEGTAHVTAVDAKPGDGAAAPAEGEAAERAIEQEIEGLRGRLDGVVGELDRRRHEALDVRLQVRRHSTAVATVGVVAAVLVVGSFVAWRNARRRQDRLLVHLGRLIVDAGRRVARPA
jgi:hypothetical protein